eukprot:16119472-Heterocapsa_arctica.AAC.1
MPTGEQQDDLHPDVLHMRPAVHEGHLVGEDVRGRRKRPQAGVGQSVRYQHAPRRGIAPAAGGRRHGGLPERLLPRALSRTVCHGDERGAEGNPFENAEELRAGSYEWQ